MPEIPPGPERFLTTRWSMVLAAARAADGGAESGARDALEELARRSWYPLYAYLRRRGEPAEEARDLVQGLFALLLERGDLARASPERGRFRAFLLTALRHHAADVRSSEATLKRGGGRTPFSIDAGEADLRYAGEPADPESPELLYERAWAREILEQALARVRDDYARRGEAEVFEALEGRLVAGAEEEGYRELARRLDTSEGALKVAAHRLRKRFGAALRETIADTVAGPAEAEDEIRALFTAFGAERR